MREVYNFLKKCGTYYLATVEGDQPRVRPFGAIEIFEDRLYLLTGTFKKVSKQIAINPKIEISAFDCDRWIRLQATAVNDNRPEPKQHMLDAYPILKSLYSAGDDTTQALYLKDGMATIYSYTSEPQVFKF